MSIRDELLFDELRGAVVDLPVGKILPGWVEKAAVIQMLDRIQAEHARDSIIGDDAHNRMILERVEMRRTRTSDRADPPC